MTEHVHRWMVGSVGGVYLAICNADDGDCGVELNAKEIDNSLNATERLSAEVAEIVAGSFEKTATAHFPGDHDGIGQALVAYARELEGTE